MLTTPLLQPQMLLALAQAGHGSKIVITDGNYPAATARGPHAQLVSLNLMPGVVNVTQVLQSLLGVVPIEAAYVMDYLRTGPYALPAEPPIWDEFRQMLGVIDPDLPLVALERYKFYDFAADPRVALVVQTADQRLYANLVLEIGVVQQVDAQEPEAEEIEDQLADN